MKIFSIEKVKFKWKRRSDKKLQIMLKVFMTRNLVYLYQIYKKKCGEKKKGFFSRTMPRFTKP